MKNWFKTSIVFLSVLLFRLIPFRAPNLEPLMATIMPIGKVYGGFVSFLFGALSITIYDSVTSGLGIWTLVTAIAYGLVGYFSYSYFKNKSGWKSYGAYSIIMTIFYDAITGLTIGPIFFGQSFSVSLLGQIPFTLIHLIGNVSSAILLSPIIEKWLVKESVSVRYGKKVLCN